MNSVAMLTRDDFLGDWRLAREIEDHYGDQRGVFRGKARFRDAGGLKLHYREEGQIQFGEGPILKAERSYHWDFSAGQVEVRFADQSPFHSFVPKGHVRGSDHPCGDDVYKVSYDFRHWPVWSATWTVTGPRKSYVSVSHYTK